MRRRWTTLLIVLGLAWGGLAGTLAAGATPKLGLDLQGGTSVILTAPEATDPDVLGLAVEIMRQRIEDFGGVQEPEIAISGSNTVLVQLPGVRDRERALDAIGQTGELSFRPVLEQGIGDVSPLLMDRLIEEQATTTTAPETEGDSTTTTPASTTSTTLPAGVDPDTGLTIADEPDQEAWLPTRAPDGTVQAVYHVGPAALRGADVADAVAGFFGGGGGQFGGGAAEWVVSLDLTAEGGRLFADLTRAAAQFPAGDPRRAIAIVLDGNVIAAPPVALDVDPNTGISGGRAQITLGGDEEEARDLAVVLRYGSLPVAFERSQVQSVSATLGEDSLRSGIVAGIGGLILVAVAILLYYRILGLITVVGLTVFGTLLITIFSLLGEFQGVTLTLAGVTGIIVSVGITADSYIVLFERIKDEVRGGRTLRSAADEGFKRAFRTILTADTVSLLGAGLLYLLAIGPVKGFALSLGIATVLDIFVARFFTRHAAALVAGSRLAGHRGVGVRAAAGLRPTEATT